MLNSNLLRQLDVQDIMVFLCVFEYKSARRSAEVLSISQSTVSYCLKRLRSCFSDVLFDSSQVTLNATSKAEAIEPYLRNILAAVNHCAEIEGDGLAVRPNRIFRICAPEYFELLLLPAVLEKFMRPDLETSLHVERLGRDVPVERLLAGEIDLAIGFGPGYHRLHPALQWDSLVSDTFVCLCASRRLPASRRLSLDEFCSMQHVFPTPWVSERNMVDAWLDKLDRSRNVVARANTYQACLNIVAKLPVVLALPQRLVPFLSIPSGVEMIEAPLGFPIFTLDVIWSTQSERSKNIQWIKAVLRELVTKEALAAATGINEMKYKEYRDPSRDVVRVGSKKVDASFKN
jgi:DNA-binding transcriptional LysR family regulator